MTETKEIKGIRTLLKSMHTDKIMTSGGKVFKEELSVANILKEYNQKRGILSQELVTAIDNIERTAFGMAKKRGTMEKYHTLKPIIEKINNLDMEYSDIC